MLVSWSATIPHSLLWLAVSVDGASLLLMVIILCSVYYYSSFPLMVGRLCGWCIPVTDGNHFVLAMAISCQ